MRIMPRIARPASPETDEIRRALAQYIIRAGDTVNSFAASHGVGQSTLFRFLSGETKTVTPSIRALVDSLHNFPIPRISEAHNARLAASVSRACARNPRLSNELAALIDAIIDATNPDSSPKTS